MLRCVLKCKKHPSLQQTHKRCRRTQNNAVASIRTEQNCPPCQEPCKAHTNLHDMLKNKNIEKWKKYICQPSEKETSPLLNAQNWKQRAKLPSTLHHPEIPVRRHLGAAMWQGGYPNKAKEGCQKQGVIRGLVSMKATMQRTVGWTTSGRWLSDHTTGLW